MTKRLGASGGEVHLVTTAYQPNNLLSIIKQEMVIRRETTNKSASYGFRSEDHLDCAGRMILEQINANKSWQILKQHFYLNEQR